MAGEDLVELKFRLADGTDIGPSKYSPATTVASLKEKILAQWPRGYSNFFIFTFIIVCIMNFVLLVFCRLVYLVGKASLSCYSLIQK